VLSVIKIYRWICHFSFNLTECICLFLWWCLTSLSTIFQIKLKFVQLSEGDYILCMTSRYFCRSFTNVTLLCFVLHSNDMTSWQSSSAENVSCNVVPFFYRHIVVIQHLVADGLPLLISKEKYTMLDKV
jgi:hypothetical protein